MLMSLRVEEAHRGQGLGLLLLGVVAEWCIDEGVRRVDLDDMSDNARSDRNIYSRAGFRYLRSWGCEMSATPSAIRRALDERGVRRARWRLVPCASDEAYLAVESPM